MPDSGQLEGEAQAGAQADASQEAERATSLPEAVKGLRVAPHVVQPDPAAVQEVRLHVVVLPPGSTPGCFLLV